MKYLAEYIAATTQIHNGKCYLISLWSEGGKTVKAYNIESEGTGAAGNTVGYIHENGCDHFKVEKPGVECTNGLNVAVDSGDCLVIWSIG